MNKERRPTSADVARLAGVSRGTVSNVLNGDPEHRVRAATAQRVLAAVDQLGYVPSAAARHLRGAPARFVLVIAPPDFTQSGEGPRILDSLARELAVRSLGMIQLRGMPRGAQPARDLSPAVVLVAAPAGSPEFEDLARGFRVPVLPAFPGRDEHIRAASRAQAEYAASRGAGRLLFVAPREPALAEMARLRLEALTHAASRAGIDLVDQATLGSARPVWASQVATWAKRYGPDCWICAYNDDVALAVLAGAHDSALRIPADLSVLGVDDTEAAERSIPGLTSVRADVEPFVRAMVTLVLRAAKGYVDSLPTLPTELAVTVRGSAR